MLRLREGRLDPQRLALSASTGVFIGLLPVPGLQTFVWLGLVMILPVDPIITYGCTWVSNPLTVLPVTLLEMQLGSLIFSRSWLSMAGVRSFTQMEILREGGHLLVGGLLLAMASGLVAYCATRVVARMFLKMP